MDCFDRFVLIDVDVCCVAWFATRHFDDMSFDFDSVVSMVVW